MDILQQSKLTRQEWISIEKPVSMEEQRILKLICDAYSNVNYRINYTQTMFSFTKLEVSSELEYFLYHKYFHPIITDTIEKSGSLSKHFELFTSASKKIKKLRSIEAMRINNLDSNIQDNKNKIYEYKLLEYCDKICKCIHNNSNDYICELYTLIQWKKNTILNCISDVMKFTNIVIEIASKKTSIISVIWQAPKIIEQNKNIIQYEDLQLYPHQKELFTLLRIQKDKEGEYIPNQPKLILYIAPTGTGKTLSPIGLCDQYKVIFVCVARHIGLALAKSAISIHKKVAFAFGCTTADDIRLHYYSAIDYTVNKRSGGIGKVDNSNGKNVEIMICDVQSYLCAMHYMLAFNDSYKVLTYWDEPTITMDYETHELHEIIHRNWCENKIPNMVLSCATLPKEYEIQDVLQDFKAYFNNATISTITSYDCKKSIPIINREGYSYLPHTQFDSIEKIREFGDFCENNKTVLRYFDLEEVVKFIGFVHIYKPCDSDDDDEEEDNEVPKPSTVVPSRFKMSNYFSDISEITMDSIKIYYLKLLQNIDGTYWNDIYEQLCDMRIPRFKEKTENTLTRSYSMQFPQNHYQSKPIEKIHSESEFSEMKQKLMDDLKGILITTKDAHTLTDGPTIYLVEDVSKIAKFYAEHSDISSILLKQIMEKIELNQKISEQIDVMEKELEEKLKKSDNSDKSNEAHKKSNGKQKVKDINNDSTESLSFNINQLKSSIQSINLDLPYIPNTVAHQEKWAPEYNNRAFVPRIDSNVIKTIMALHIEPSFKLLTLMGVGVLMKQQNTNYEEVVKRLAQDQQLFVILTTSDYIYGTNYQFCHGFIGEDLENMTQQKTLQSMGRIGRNNIQQNYTVRFRDNKMIDKLFQYPSVNLEAINMNKLFCHDE
jgi:hypothetical protein